MNIKQSQHKPLPSNTNLSKYTLLHYNPLIKYIYNQFPLSNFLPKHIFLFIITLIPSIACVIFNSIHFTSMYSLLISSLILTLLLILFVLFIFIYTKTKSISFITSNPKINCCFYLTIYASFSIGLIALRNAVKSTMLRDYIKLQIDFIYTNIELIYSIIWLCCGYCEYIYTLIINVVIIAIQIPFICVDVRVDIVTVCSIVIVHCVGVVMSYVVTLLKKKLFIYEGNYCSSKDDIGKVVDELGLGVVTVSLIGNNKRRDVKCNAVFNGKEVLKEIIGEKGEHFEKLFTEIKDANEDIEWSGFGNYNNNNNNNIHKRRSEVNCSTINNNNNSHRYNNSCYYSNRCNNSNINCNSNNTTTRQLNPTTKQMITFTNNNASLQSSSNPTHLYLLNQLNLLPSKTYLSRPSSSLSITANPFTSFLSSLVSYSSSTIITPLCTCIVPQHTSSSSSPYQSPTHFLYLKTYYFYNPLLQHVKFIFVDESQNQYENAFKTYIQQISMYLHDFKNPLVTIEEKVKQIKDIITYMFNKLNYNYNNDNDNNNTDTNVELEQELYGDINFVSHTASDCVCMVRSYENFAKRVISNSNEPEQIELMLFPLKEVYDYLTEWMTMKLEMNGAAVHFELRLGEGITPHFMLCTDKMKLKQILINILSNAIKFTQEGLISLVITRTVSNGKRYTKFLIEDTGSGMNKTMKENLFTPFVSNNKCKNNKYGCGLGMVISMQNSKVLGKEIQVESVEGKGTIMWFYVEEKEAPQSQISTFNMINENNVEGIRKVFRDELEGGNKVKKANTLYHNVFGIRNVKCKLQQQHTVEKSICVQKSKTLPSTLASSECAAVPKATANDIDDNNNNNNNNKHNDSLSINATELFNDPIQILPNHKSIYDSMSSATLTRNVFHSQKLLKHDSPLYKYDKSQTTKCSFILTKQNTNINNNMINNANTINDTISISNDIIPCSFNINNLQNIPVSKTAHTPMLSFYKKNSLMSPSSNGMPLRNNINNINGYCNSNSISHHKARPQLDIVRTSSSSCMAIKKFLKKEYNSAFYESPSQLNVTAALDHFSVLLCDDDESIQHAHMRMLNERNIHKVDKVSDGLDLVKMFLHGELNMYDLILVDYSMCYMDGTDAIKVIRFMRDNAIGERCNFNYDVLKRIIFATGAMDVVKDVLNDKNGEFKYYNKPINKRDLKKILKEFGATVK